MSTHHLIEAIAEEELHTPVCPCGSTDLIVAYEATITQRVMFVRSQDPGVWNVDSYDSQHVNEGFSDVRIECRSCLRTFAREGEQDDVFTEVDPDEPGCCGDSDRPRCCS